MRGLPNDSIAQKGNISLWSLQTVSSGCCQCKQYPYLASFQVTWLTGENRNRKKRECPCTVEVNVTERPGDSPALAHSSGWVSWGPLSCSLASRRPFRSGHKSHHFREAPANLLQGNEEPLWGPGHRSVYMAGSTYKVAASPKVIKSAISQKKLPWRQQGQEASVVLISVSHIQPMLQSEGQETHEGSLWGPNAPLEVQNRKWFQPKMELEDEKWRPSCRCPQETKLKNWETDFL